MKKKKSARSASYGLPENTALKTIAAPQLDYLPPMPKKYRPRIGLIGCGGISQHHLQGYRNAGWNVVALADLVEERAAKRRDELFPKAQIFTDYRKMLAESELEVVDIATHPKERVKIIRDTLNAGCHVLSQKPFVLDLDEGRKLIALADRKKLRLAVNQNGRWAPYFSYLRRAVQAGLIGKMQTADLRMNWDHTWTQGTAFEKIHHLILYDFAIHWFDMVTCFFAGRQAKRVFASAVKSPGQVIAPPFLAHCAVEFPNGLATLSFNAHSKFGGNESTTLVGTKGTIQCDGPLCAGNSIRLYTAKGIATPKLKGSWFPDGFRGAMGGLLCAIEEKREPENSARNNLKSLEICFAALDSADTGQPRIPGKVRDVRK
jgi:predicted dehydrogenase